MKNLLIDLARRRLTREQRQRLRGSLPGRAMITLLGVQDSEGAGSAAAKDPERTAILRNATRKLWAGHSRAALTDLVGIARDEWASANLRARAAYNISRYYLASGQPEDALEWLTHATLTDLGSLDSGRAALLRATSLEALERFDEAFETLALSAAGKAGTNNRLLIASNIKRTQAVQSDGSEPADAALADVDREIVTDLNAMYTHQGVQPISRRDPDAPLSLANLGGATKSKQAARKAVAKRGPTVSVLMPAYNASKTVDYAIKSILEQTHQNVEVIVVDDNSPDNTVACIAELASRDSRVRYLTSDENLGPYSARNRALAIANGEVVTVNDADDWTHPQRIELQLKELQQNRKARFTFSRLVRVQEGFRFSMRPYRPMVEPIHWSYTSIMGWASDFRALGGWDPAMAHADAEFIDRIKEIYGERALQEVCPDVPLAFFADGAQNITNSQGMGLRSVEYGARKEYQEQARHWRARKAQWRLDEADIDPQSGLITRNDGRRPFYVPNALLPPSRRRATQYDIIFLSDLSLLGGTRRCNLEYFRLYRENGWRVAVVNVPRYRGRGTGGIDATYRDLFDEGSVDLLTPEDEAEAGCVIIHHPPIMGNVLDQYPQIRAQRVGILVNQLPVQSRLEGAEQFYDPAAVEDLSEELFGQRPWWIPISGLVTEELAKWCDSAHIWPDEWYPIVGEVARHAPDRRAANHSDKIVLGRHSRDHATKWPGTYELVQKVYPKQPDISVHILGGAGAVVDSFGRTPSNWHIEKFDARPVNEFLAGLNVFVHWPRDDYIEEFGRNVAEAMAMGIPCILSPALRPTFGDAALYPEPDDVADVARRLVEDDAERDALIERGRAFVEGHCLPHNAVARIERFLAETE